jgi:hypothetical protein
MRRNYLFIVLGIIPITYVLFFYPFAFNFEIRENGHYLLLLLSSLVQVARVLWLTERHPRPGQMLFDGILSLTVLFVYMVTGGGNEYAGVWLSFAIILGLFIQATTRQLMCLLYCLLPFLFIELVLAFLQCCRSAPIVGSLQNTGIFSIYLVVHMPLAFHAAFKNNQTKRFPRNFLAGAVFALFFIFSVYSMVKGQSRTALLCLILVALFMLPGKLYSWIVRRLASLSAWSRYAIMAGTLLLPAAIFYRLYSLKQLSAHGRLLMSYITTIHLPDHFWLGTGIGRFTWYYPQWQAEYFRDTLHPPHDFLLSAGESFVICNEFLQLCATIGVIGFLAFLFGLFAFFRKGSHRLHDASLYQDLSQYKDLDRTVKLTAMAILACGFTSYPFHINIVLFLFALCLVLGYKLNGRMAGSGIRNKKAGHIFRAVTVCASISLLLLVFYKNTAVWKWQRLRNNDDLSYQEEKTAYRQLYPVLKNDGKFLAEYGSLLMEDTTECRRAVSILEDARTYFISRQATESLGYAYWKANDLPHAIGIFRWEADYLPDLFGPKLMLMKLYKQAGDMNKMKAIGQLIIDTPPKIPSGEVNTIKREAQLLLDQGATPFP